MQSSKLSGSIFSSSTRVIVERELMIGKLNSPTEREMTLFYSVLVTSEVSV